MSTRYQHVRFYKLKTGEDFFLGKFRYTKTSYFLGHAVLDGNVALAMPWMKVRSARPFGKVKPITTEVQTLTGEGPRVSVYERPLGEHLRPLPVRTRPPQPVTPGGDRRSETIGGNEKCISS